MHQQIVRFKAVQRLRLSMERDGFPRLQMFLLVAITGAAGFLASYCLLNAGIAQMAIRYFLAVCCAYLVFLGLLWLWLRTRAADYLEIPDMSPLLPSGRSDEPVVLQGQGGGFDGGGASGWFEPAEQSGSALAEPAGPVAEALGAAAEADELAIPLAAVVLLAAALLSSLFVVYSAPLLFAELLVDGALAASLYRRLRGIESRHWLETALRRTFWPFACTALVAAAAGGAMAFAAPHAHSFGGFLLHLGQGI